MIDIIQLIQERILNEDEQDKRAVEPLESFHASSTGYCARQIFLTKIHAKKFDLNIKGSMEVGSALHHRIQWYPKIKELFDVEVPIKVQIEGSPVFILGSADLVAKDKSLVADIKSINGLTYVSSSPMREHLVQLNVYLKGLGINDGQIVYVNKPNMELAKHDFKYDEKMYQGMCMKLITIYVALKRWDAEGTFEQIPFSKCGCYFCKSENLDANFGRLLK